MAFFITQVTRWESEKRDSSYRIAPADGTHRDILLNPNRICELIEDPESTLPIPKSIFNFFDNFLNRRESPSRLWVNDAVQTIIDAGDTPFHSTMITLNIHKYNNPNKPTVATTIPVSAIAYADRYNPDPNNHCWIVYYLAGFKRREVLADLSIEQLEDIAETGTTSTTTTTSDR